jgi:hypothetical protein
MDHYIRLKTSKNQLKYGGALISLLFIHIINLFIVNQKYVLLGLIVLISPIATTLIISMFRKKDFLFFSFVLILHELLLVMSFRILIFRVQEDSWRFLYDIDTLNLYSFKYILCSLSIFLIIYILKLISDHDSRWENENRLCHVIPFHPVIIDMILLFSFFYCIFFIVHADIFFQARNYNDPINPSLLAFFRMFLVLNVFIFYHVYCQNKFICLSFKSLVFVLYLITSIQMSLNGWRFTFVEVATVSFFLYYKKEKKASILALFFLFLTFYIMIIVSKSFYKNVEWSSVLFEHERNVFFSLNAIIQNRPSNSVNTYFTSFMNLLPSIITGKTVPNTGRILVRYIVPQLEEYGITMGGFYLTEAFFSFGFWGIYAITMIFAILFLWIENMKARKFGIFQMLYYYILALITSIIYYGSSNSFKLIVYFFIVLMLCNLCNRLILRSYNLTRVCHQIRDSGIE